ncbi:MAG: alpha-amylase, partial [Dehalococcoidia bacterium]|nr:alpha-amylase [Dehalococcoidia bacterium]
MTARDLHLSLAFHNHQPVGNSPTVLAWAYRQSYLPLVETLESHPGIRVSLHYSGPLLDWILENRPEFLDRLGSLAGRGQVEIMGG